MAERPTGKCELTGCTEVKAFVFCQKHLSALSAEQRKALRDTWDAKQKAEKTYFRARHAAMLALTPAKKEEEAGR